MNHVIFQGTCRTPDGDPMSYSAYGMKHPETCEPVTRADIPDLVSFFATTLWPVRISPRMPEGSVLDSFTIEFREGEPEIPGVATA